MKVRHGFVSNSSTSSFLCVVCGHEAAGMDMCLSEAGMVECVNCHTFCEEHVIGDYKKPVEEMKAEILEVTPDFDFTDMDDDDIEGEWECNYKDEDYIPAGCCPICQMQSFDSDDLIQYFFKKHNTTIDKVREEVKAQFKKYEDFVAFITEKE